MNLSQVENEVFLCREVAVCPGQTIEHSLLFPLKSQCQRKYTEVIFEVISMNVNEHLVIVKEIMVI